MSKASVRTVEFFGGPLDGHEQVVCIPADQLEDVVLLPVGKVLALLYRDRAYRQMTSMAVYRLIGSPQTALNYQYLGPVSACTC